MRTLGVVAFLAFPVSTTVEAAPNFPIVLDGDWCNVGDCPYLVTPWRWIVYADGSYDEGSPVDTFPDPGGVGTDGSWTFAGGELTMIHGENPPEWGYRGTAVQGCVSGVWANLPHDGAIDGDWNACIQ